MASIAIVGMACEFPGRPFAGRALAKCSRRPPLSSARRRRSGLPPEYFDPDPETPGTSYADQMAVLEGWQFDPLEFRIPPVSFEASDMAHWLALYVARAAIQQSGIDLTRPIGAASAWCWAIRLPASFRAATTCVTAGPTWNEPSAACLTRAD